MPCAKHKAFNHRHRAEKLRFQNAVAVTPKENDRRACLGDVGECECGALVFFPHTLGLYPIEVEMMPEKAA